MFYELTTSQTAEILDYVNGTGPIPSQDALTCLNSTYTALNKKLYRELVDSKGKQAKLEKRVESYRKKDDDRAAAGVFSETVPGLDSVTVAKALIYCLRQKETYKLNMPKVIAILYEMYASWLASKRERLFSHHPQATQYGPHFWRVANKAASLQASYDDFKTMAEIHPGIAEFCKNAAKKYYDWKLSDIVRPFVNSKPYRNALPEHNGGKWGKELSDADIYAWKTNL